MASYHISPATSVYATAPGSPAFALDSPVADALTVDAGAFLVSQAAEGARLANTGAWTVAVRGTILSLATTGLFLNAENPEVSTIVIGAEGEVSGQRTGIDLSSAATLRNAGLISANSGLNGTGIAVSGAGLHEIRNTGLIDAGQGILDNGGFGIEQVTNSGTITGNISLSGGDDRLANSGAIGGQVFLGPGADILVNAGSIAGFFTADSGDDAVTNTGTFGYIVLLGDGADSFVNTGLVKGDVYLDFSQVDTGADVFSNVQVVDGVRISGTVLGTIHLGGGGSRFTGGDQAETVEDGTGADAVALGGGDDVFQAVGVRPGPGLDDADTIEGGAGVDGYDAHNASRSVFINLDGVAHDLSPFAPGAQFVAANTALGEDVAPGTADRVTHVENAYGGAAADVIYGSGAANRIEGNGGADVLFGFRGDDVLAGGASFDNLVGGLGADTLTGGTEADSFTFLRIDDSGITPATRDRITDFEDGRDVIALDQIDAVRGTKGDDAFAFIGTNVGFGGIAGELRAYFSARGQVLEGDVDGDGAADFSITVDDANHAIVFTAADFVL